MRGARWLAAAAVALAAGQAGAAAPAAGQGAGGEPALRMQRQAAGLGVGWWGARLAERPGVEYAETPYFEAHFQRGLDARLAVVSSIGLWRRRQRANPGGVPGQQVAEEITSYIVPLFTAVRYFPLTRPGAFLEPYVRAGLGFALGLDDRQSTAGGVLGGGTGTGMGTGLGFAVGAGVETRLTRAIQLDASAGWRWLRFGSEVGLERSYAGPAVDIGLAYRLRLE
jgi:opacity protein-like surface antigen